MATSQMYAAAQAILQALGAAPTAAGINLLVAWMQEEDGANSTIPCNNPMNSTLSEPGSHTVNYVGVECYPNLSTGVTATIATLGNGDYNTLLQAVKTGNANLFFGSQGRGELGTWSTGTFGANPQYADAIYSLYQALPSPPSQYLSGTTTAANTPNPVANFVKDLPGSVWDIVLIGSGLAIGLAAAKFLVFERQEGAL